MSSEALFQQFDRLEISLLKKNHQPKNQNKKARKSASFFIISFNFYYYHLMAGTHTTQEVKNNLVNSQPALLKQNEISFNLNKTSRLNFLWLVAHRMISLIQTTLCRGRNALYETLLGYKRAVKAKLFEL